MLPAIGATDVFAMPPDPEELHPARRFLPPTKQERFVSECPSQMNTVTVIPSTASVFMSLINSSNNKDVLGGSSIVEGADSVTEMALESF